MESLSPYKREVALGNMDAKEPIQVYYNQPLMNAMRRNIRTRIEEADPEVLSKVCALLDKEKNVPSFEERFERAKAFAYAHFDETLARDMEKHNFYIGESFPAERYNSEEEFDRMIREAEESGVCTDEEVKGMFAIWKV